MNDYEVAQELVRRGIIGANELNGVLVHFVLMLDNVNKFGLLPQRS